MEYVVVSRLEGIALLLTKFFCRVLVCSAARNDSPFNFDRRLAEASSRGTTSRSSYCSISHEFLLKRGDKRPFGAQVVWFSREIQQ